MDRAVTAAAALPAPRDELRLLPADANPDGSPAWLIQDPVCNRFYRIGWMDFEMLVRWRHGSPRTICDAVNAETTLAVEPGDVESLARFLDQHSLLQPAGEEAVDALRRRAEARKQDLGWRLLHNYLFFRIPLVKPQDALARLLPWLRWAFTPGAWVAIGLLTLLGIVLVARQWDTFTSTFVDHFTIEGVLGFSMAVAVAKMLHELGHAIAATRYGVRVAHMGVAMVVLFPMLYTDTSESWKLARPRQRLAIASAGILTELAIAGIATLLWILAPDGAFRTAMFFLATTTWVLTLAINASPFMRFDGYFILSDLLNFPNLHERSGALARVWLRRRALGLDLPWPEALPPGQVRGLVAFAVLTWVYRLVVFLGIAVLVYLFFFKVLGIILMLVELGWFIARPVGAELKVWWDRRSGIKTRRKWAAGLLAGGLLLVLLVPWRSGVHADGVVHAARQQLVFSPRAGQVAALPRPGAVAEGDVLFALSAPDLRTSQHRAQVLADARALELLGLGGLKDGEERRALVESEREKFLAEAGVFSGEQSRMQLVAPFAGHLLDQDPHLRVGVWVQPRQPLGMLVDPASWVAEAFVAEDDVGRIKVGNEVRVNVGWRSPHPIAGKVVQVDSARTVTLPYAVLDASAGGPIVTLPPGRKTGVPSGLCETACSACEWPSRGRRCAIT